MIVFTEVDYTMDDSVYVIMGLGDCDVWLFGGSLEIGDLIYRGSEIVVVEEDFAVENELDVFVRGRFVSQVCENEFLEVLDFG